MSDESAFDYLFKILMIGDSGTGKTSILTRFINNKFSADNESTMAVEFSTRNISTENKIVKVQCWDTVGEEKYKSITSAYYRGAVGALLLYDITKRSTFDSCPKWLLELREYTSENIVTLLVGNKTDLRHLREVSSEEGSAQAKENGMLFVETSAQSGSNVDKAFHIIIKEIIKNLSEKTNQTERNDYQYPSVFSLLKNKDTNINGSDSTTLQKEVPVQVKVDVRKPKAKKTRVNRKVHNCMVL